MNPQRKAMMQVAIVNLLKQGDATEDDVALAICNVFEPIVDELTAKIEEGASYIAATLEQIEAREIRR